MFPLPIALLLVGVPRIFILLHVDTEREKFPLDFLASNSVEEISDREQQNFFIKEFFLLRYQGGISCINTSRRMTQATVRQL